jgi:hypothetical protein
MQPAASEAVGVFGENGGPAEPDPAVGMARPSWFPPLPRGYSEQGAWGFHDSAGLSYEFYRVYGPSEPGGGRGDLCRIDEARSFWSVIWPSFSESAGEHIEGRWLSFAQARDRLDGKLTFARFSSPLEMTNEIPRWLQT